MIFYIGSVIQLIAVLTFICMYLDLPNAKYYLTVTGLIFFYNSKSSSCFKIELRELVHRDKTFHLKQRSPMYFLCWLTFRFQSGKHHQNSNAFVVCKDKSKPNKKNIGNQK